MATPVAASHVIKMPQLSDTMTEGVVVSWEKSVGDKIERGDVVAQVETDKAIMDVEVFRTGYLSGPIAEVDSVLPVGGAMAYLVDSADEIVQGGSVTTNPIAAGDVTSPSHQEARHQIASAHRAPGHKPPARQMDTSGVTPAVRPDNKYATPYARQLAAAFHVNLNTLKGTGPIGEIVAADVRRAQPLQRPSEVQRQTPAHIMPEVQVPGHDRLAYHADVSCHYQRQAGRFNQGGQTERCVSDSCHRKGLCACNEETSHHELVLSTRG
jgi:dihydrolipoamide dehydrogenase